MNILDLISQENYSRALSAIDVEIKDNPDESALYFLKGRCLLNLDKLEKSEEMLDKALKLDKNNGWAWLEKAFLYDKMGWIDRSITCLNMAENTLPDPDIVLYIKGQIFMNHEEWEIALDFFNQVLVVNPTHEDCYYQKGLCLQQLERHNDAISCFNAVLEIDDTNNYDGQAFIAKITSLVAIGNTEEALAASDALKEIAGESEGYWHQRAFIYVGMGDIEQALMCLDKAININPTFVPALQAKNIILNNL